MNKDEQAALAALRAGDLEGAMARLKQRMLKLVPNRPPRATSVWLSTMTTTSIAEHLGIEPPGIVMADLSVPGIVTLTAGYGEVRG
jgi:hypothetical protein